MPHLGGRCSYPGRPVTGLSWVRICEHSWCAGTFRIRHDRNFNHYTLYVEAYGGSSSQGTFPSFEEAQQKAGMLFATR